HASYHNGQLVKYKLLGKISVEPTRVMNQILEFNINVKNLDFIQNIRSNPNFCILKGMNEEISNDSKIGQSHYKCRTPSSFKPNEEITLLQFIANPLNYHLPIQCIPKVKLTERSINLLLWYKINSFLKD